MLDVVVQKAKRSSEYIFQRDSDFKHKSKITMKYFVENKLELLTHLPQFSNINPIKKLYGYIEFKFKKRTIKNLRGLKYTPQEI